MPKKTPKTIKAITLIMISLLLVSCGKPKQIVMKSSEEIAQTLGDDFYSLKLSDSQSFTPKDQVYSVESGVYPYVVSTDSGNSSIFSFQYAGEDWIFMKKIVVKTDEHEYKLDIDSSDVNREVEESPSVCVTERIAYGVDRKNYDMLTDMANSEETSVTFSGEKPAYFELTDRNKKILKLFLSCFEEK